MPHGLLLGFPAQGHMRPLLVLARELRKQGHALTFYSSPFWRQPVEETGAVFRPYRDDFLSDFRFGPDQLPDMPALLMEAAEATLRREMQWIRKASVDFVVHDSLSHSGGSIARTLGVPAISSITTFVLTPRVLLLARGIFRPPPTTSFRRKAGALIRALGARRRIRHELRLPAPRLRDLLCARAPLNIVYSSRRFHPFESHFGEGFQFVGPAQLPDLNDRSGAQGPARIFVSLGTLFNRDIELFRTLFKVFETLPVQAVVTTGKGLSPEQLGPVGPNVQVHDFVDQQEVLSTSAAAVSRGGLNTISECIAQGVPTLVIPELAEQAVVARRTADCGTGLYLRRDRATATRVGQIIRQLLERPSFVHQCKDVADGFRRAGGARRAAELIDAHLNLHG